ncbi:unnamed protein product [Candida verbasci]|uniref:Ubiquitin-like protease family profile domain-containing protein n=1 Tax=Candida verbasci TaxID=1227364 RepID=A0A9W4TS42_9ASCO|nr:unnamed protein product [Candida verbasci]
MSTILRSIINYIKKFIFLIFINKTTVEDHQINQEESDSDLEYIKTQYLYTNDFHIVSKNERNNNSILQDSIDEIEPSQESNPIPTSSTPSTPSTSQLLRQLTYKRSNQTTNNQPSDQYGTNLSIANPINYSYKTKQQQLIKHEPRESILNIRNDITPYQESILNYYIPTKPISLNQHSLIDNFISDFYIDKISSIYESTSNNLQSTITKKRLENLQVVKSLDYSQLAKVHEIWSSRSNQIVAKNPTLEISTQDLFTLKDGRWLNDNIIDFYLELVMKKYPTVFAWTTHFYSTLSGKGYSGVSKWAKRRKVDQYKKEKVLVPVNISNTHWALSVIDNIEKTITYYDSLDTKHGNPQAVKNLNEYMRQEALRLGHTPIEYELISFFKSPQQNNGSDCGVFTCTAAKFISGNQELKYSQKDMKNIRRRMVWEILNSNVID